MRKQKIGIVGSGIVGLAHAWSAAERGHLVTVFERSDKASGASIRNFGMVWPIGQPEPTRQIAMKSRERWLTLAQHAGLWVNICGSIHLAHREDEWEVLNEFMELASGSDLATHLKILSPAGCKSRSAAIQPNGFYGGLHSDMELCVNPTEATRAIPHWLNQTFGVQFQFSSPVTEIDRGWLRTSNAKHEGFDRIIVCSGHDFESLFPDVFRSVTIRRCKLQMMRTVGQSSDWKLGPHLASGLTLRHYPSFRHCGSLQKVIDRVANEAPELNRFGIHVMASQDNQNRVVLGDSHEYDSAIDPFDSTEIDELILRELQKIIWLPSWQIESRWNGIYAKYPDEVSFECEPIPSVHIATGLGGSGMTLGFGIAERAWTRWSNEL